jgi:hypothetical protein
LRRRRRRRRRKRRIGIRRKYGGVRGVGENKK